MKTIITIFFLFFCYSIVAQQRFPIGPPTQFSTGFFRQGYPMSDSGLIVANRDTNWLAKYSGTVVFKPSNKKFYWFDSTTLTWNSFADAIDTTSLSNRINLKLNITDTTAKWWGIGKRWVDTVYRVNDSTIGFTINGGIEQTFEIKGGASGGGGSGTVTSVGLSLPSAFNVTPATITTSGTFAVTGAGTTAQYIRGNGTLATTDSGMIPDFHLKVRSLLSGSSPITFNQTTGIIGINNANTSGTKGAASFTSSFSDNGSGLIDLADLVTASSCTNCDITFDSKGRATAFANGSGGGGGLSSISNTGSGFRLVAAPNGVVKTVFGNYALTIDSSSNSNALTWKIDTTELKNVFLPLNLNSNKVINQASNSIRFVGGGQVLFDSTNHKEYLSFIEPDSLSAYGNSITVGMNASVPDSQYINQLSDYYDLDLINHALGGSGIWNAAKVHYANINPGHKAMTTAMAGFNDARRGGAAQKTLNKIIWSHNAILANHFLKSFIYGGSASGSIVRDGTWTNTYQSASVGGKSPSTGSYSNVLNDSISYSFTDSTVVLGLIGGDSSGANYDFALFDIRIDHAPHSNFSEGNKTDGISDGVNDNKRNGIAYVIRGLSYGPHTVTLVNKSSGAYLIVDYFGHLVDRSNAYPLMVFHAPKMDATGYAISPANATDAVIDTVNVKIDSIVNSSQWRGYPIYIARTNDYYIANTSSGLSSDHIHPNDVGMRQIKNSGIASLPNITSGVEITNGTIIYTNVGYRGKVNGTDIIFGSGGGTVNAILANPSTPQDAYYSITGPATVGSTFRMGATGGTSSSSPAFRAFTGGSSNISLYKNGSDNYIFSADSTTTTGINTHIGAGTFQIGVLVGGSITDYATFNYNGSNAFLSIMGSSPFFQMNTNVFYGAIGNFGQLGVNRNPTSGVFADATKAAAQLSIKASVDTGQIQFWTTNLNNTDPIQNATLFGSGNFSVGSTIDNTVGKVQVNGKITVTTHTIASNSDSAVVWNRTTKEYEYAKINTGSSGITTLNTLTASTQTFATGTSGTDFGITSSTSTHTFNLPSASTSNRGVVTTSSQTFGGIKTFNDGIVVTSGGNSRITINGNISVADGPSTYGDGLAIDFITHTNTSAAGTVSGSQNFNFIANPTLTSSNAISYTGDVATIRFVGAPVAAGSTTISHPWNILANDVNYLAGIAMSLNEQAADATIANASGVNIYTGAGGNTWTLPALATHPGKFILIKNAGGGNLTVQRAGSDNIYNTVSVTSITVAAGADVVLAAGSSFWYVLGF